MLIFWDDDVSLMNSSHFWEYIRFSPFSPSIPPHSFLPTKEWRLKTEQYEKSIIMKRSLQHTFSSFIHLLTIPSFLLHCFPRFVESNFFFPPFLLPPLLLKSSSFPSFLPLFLPLFSTFLFLPLCHLKYRQIWCEATASDDDPRHQHPNLPSHSLFLLSFYAFFIFSLPSKDSTSSLFFLVLLLSLSLSLSSKWRVEEEDEREKY